MNNILNCLKIRSAWYEKAIRMAKREIPVENGFDWPLYPGERSPFSPLNIPYWEGAQKEIDNTIGMLEHEMRRTTA